MTSSGHLSRELLDGFFLGRVTPLELLGEAAGHLEETCPECRRRLEPGRLGYRRALREAGRRVRARAEEIEAERAALPARLAELGARRGSGMFLLVAGSPRFHTAAFTELELGRGWAAVERDELAAAREAVELGYLAAVRLDRGRYGRIAVARLEAESFLLRARLALALGNREEAELALEAAEELLPFCLTDDLRAGLLLARASFHLWQGEEPAARRLLDEASRLAVQGRAERWRPSIETALARLERRGGRPELAAERLRRLFREFPDGPRDLASWSAARELVGALVAAGEADEAAVFITWWRGEEERPVGEHLGEGRPELALSQARILADRGRRLGARRALWSAWVLLRIHGRGLDAALAVLELARLGAAPGPDGEALASRESLLRALEELILREAVPGEGLVLIARLARALCRDRLDERELAEIEGLYLRLRPAWGVAGHVSP